MTAPLAATLRQLGADIAAGVQPVATAAECYAAALLVERGASLARAVEAERVARCRHEASAFGAPFFDTRRELWAAEAVTRDALAALRGP